MNWIEYIQNCLKLSKKWSKIFKNIIVINLVVVANYHKMQITSTTNVQQIYFDGNYNQSQVSILTQWKILISCTLFSLLYFMIAFPATSCSLSVMPSMYLVKQSCCGVVCNDVLWVWQLVGITGQPVGDTRSYAYRHVADNKGKLFMRVLIPFERVECQKTNEHGIIPSGLKIWWWL